MHKITKKVIEEAIRARRVDNVRLRSLEAVQGEFDFREDDIAANDKIIAQLKEDLQTLYEHAKR